MQKLLITQASVDYYGFFATTAFELMGEQRLIFEGLSKTFEAHNLSLANFRLEGDISEPATNAVIVRLGRFGTYKFKFDQVQATLNGFSDSELEGMVSVIDNGDSWLRTTVKDFHFKSHAFVYAGHGVVSGGKSSKFLLSLPRREIPTAGEDLGAGVLETWRDAHLDAKVRILVDHSLQEPDGLFINYMVVFDRDKVEYVDAAQHSRVVLNNFLNQLGLEFGEEEAVVL